MTRSSRLSTLAIWGLASWALPLVVVFLVSPRLLHLVGPERFGVLMIALVTPLVASQLEFGVSTAAVRRLAERLPVGRIDAGTTLCTLFVSLSLIGVALGTAIWVAASPLSRGLGFTETLGADQGPTLIRACAVWFALTLATLLPGILARAAQSMLLISVVQTTATLVLWLGAWLLLSQTAPLVGVVALGLVLTVLAAGATLWAVRRLVDWSGPVRFDPRLLSESARFSAGLFAAQAAGSLVNQGDRVLVAALASPAVAGLYALCVNIANKTVAAVVALTSFVYPHVAGLQSAGQQAATVGLVHALERAIAAVIVPVLVPGLLLADTFLRLWLGDFATPELTTAFRILLVAFGVLALAVPVSNVLVACGKSGMSARYSWLTVVVAFGAMYFAVPRFGLVGAAGAMLVGYSTSLVFAASARRVLRIPPAGNRLRYLGGLAVGCAAQVLLVAVFGERASNWLDLIAIGAAAWASFYAVRAAVSALTPEETQFLRRFAEAAAARAKRWAGRKASR